MNTTSKVASCSTVVVDGRPGRQDDARVNGVGRYIDCRCSHVKDANVNRVLFHVVGRVRIAGKFGCALGCEIARAGQRSMR